MMGEKGAVLALPAETPFFYIQTEGGQQQSTQNLMSTTSIIYVRVSTADQDLDHQREALWEYAVDTLGVAASDLDVLEDRSTGNRHRPERLPSPHRARS